MCFILVQEHCRFVGILNCCRVCLLLEHHSICQVESFSTLFDSIWAAIDCHVACRVNKQTYSVQSKEQRYKAGKKENLQSLYIFTTYHIIDNVRTSNEGDNASKKVELYEQQLVRLSEI